MKHLIRSFQDHVGLRGVHFYDEDSCSFLTWKEVFEFLGTLPGQSKTEDPFAEQLAESLANYNPDKEYLAVQQHGSTVSVELYSNAFRDRKK